MPSDEEFVDAIVKRLEHVSGPTPAQVEARTREIRNQFFKMKFGTSAEVRRSLTGRLQELKAKPDRTPEEDELLERLFTLLSSHSVTSLIADVQVDRADGGL